MSLRVGFDVVGFNGELWCGEREVEGGKRIVITVSKGTHPSFVQATSLHCGW